MKKIIYAMLMVMPMLMTSCDDDDVTIVLEPTASGTMYDDDGNEYGWVRVGNLDWTTSNARNGMPFYDYRYYSNFDYLYVGISYDETLYEDEVDYVDNSYNPLFGNLMSYDEAVASAPDGWRLPTDEDWKALERSLGMTDADNKGWRGANGVSSRLMAQDGLGLGFKLGGGAVMIRSFGWMSMELNSIGEYGYFWSSTIEPSYTDTRMAYFRKLVYGQSGVERQCSNAAHLMSVRWCRDAVNE